MASTLSYDTVFTKFRELDPKNKQTIKFDVFNKLSSDVGFVGDGVGADMHFADGVVTFSEVCKISGLGAVELPIGLNVVAEVFRTLDPENSNKVHLAALAKKLQYFYAARTNVDDVEVSFQQALEAISGPRQQYKLNVFKDIFRRFGRDGDGTLKSSELKAAARFLDLSIKCDLDVVTMNDLLPVVVPDPNHDIFKLGVNMNEVRKAFDWCDADHNNYLDTEEFAKSLRLSGQNPSQADIKRLKAEFDQDNDGVFDFDEFTAVVCRGYVSKDAMRKKAMQAFAVFDTDESGTISLQELRRIMTTYGEDMTDEEVDDLFHELDTNDDGQLEIQELVDVLLH